MAVQLNHTIVWCHDKYVSSDFLTHILGLPPAQSLYHFKAVTLSNDVSLDFMEKEGDIAHQHYAFLLTEAEFDQAFARIEAANIVYWADPARTRPGKINHHDGGRGMYFPDPDGHLLEIITRPYGAAS